MSSARDRVSSKAGRSKSPSLAARIQVQYASLPGSERKVADLILDFPGEIAAYSATELAELAGASKAAVTRLIRRLGYASFEQARRAARDAQRWGSPVYLLSKEQQRQAFSNQVTAHIERDVRNISRTFAGLDEATLAQIIEAVASAKRVALLGYRNSHILASYLRWQLILVRADVHLLPSAGETLAEDLADLTREDLLIVIGFRRRMPEVARALKLARASAVPLLFITDPTARQMPAATWTVRCEVRTENLFDSYAAAISLLHFLSVGVVKHTGTRGRARLKRIEQLHETLHDFNK